MAAMNSDDANRANFNTQLSKLRAGPSDTTCATNA